MRRVPILYGLITALAVLNCVPSFAHRLEVYTGRCHMGYCHKFKIISKELTGSSAVGSLYKVRMKNWWVKKETKQKLEEGSTSTSYFLCSKNKPALIGKDDGGHGWEVAVLNVHNTFGAVEKITIEYYAVCHGIVFDDVDEGASRLRYPEVKSSSFFVKSPKEVLKR
ncbi:MAG: hypothetical protein NVSMB58_35710 [Terriglobales bacterium]